MVTACLTYPAPPVDCRARSITVCEVAFLVFSQGPRSYSWSECVRLTGLLVLRGRPVTNRVQP